MKLQFIGNREQDEIIYCTNLEDYIDDIIIRNNISSVNIKNSIKLINTTLTQTEYKKFGFMNYKIKAPDYIITSTVNKKMLEYYINSCRYFDSYRNTIDYSKGTPIPCKDREYYKYPEYRGYYYNELKSIINWISEIEPYDSSQILFEDDIVNKFENGESFDEFTIELVKNCKNNFVITNTLNMYDFRSEMSWIGSYIRNYVDKRQVMGRNIHKKYKIHERTITDGYTISK